jgi:hypothetical protein
MRSLGPDVQISAEESALTGYDYHCPLMSAPHAFGTGIDNVPARVPYLHAEPDRAAQWRRRIGETGFKIGISWQGNELSPVDRGRSLPVGWFRSLATLPGVRLISLQVGPGREQLRELPGDMIVEDLGEDFDRGPDAFVDSAAAMHSLDLIVTSDTALAHLAGALGLPTWVVLQFAPDWRWLRSRDDSPWYPTMKLFRQPTPGRWDEVFEAVRTGLVSMSAARSG